MTSTVAFNRDVIEFLRLLLGTNRVQRLGVLRNITRKQCTILRHLAYNIMFNSSIELSVKDKSYLKHQINSLKILASKKVCLADKKDIFAKKHLLIKRLAQLGLKYLE